MDHGGAAEVNQDMDNLEPHPDPHTTDVSPLQSYFDWQVTTLMLAHDLVAPISRGNDDAAGRRRQSVEQEVRDMVMGVLPDPYKENPTLDWPPQIMMAITKATLQRAMDIAGS